MKKAKKLLLTAVFAVAIFALAFVSKDAQAAEKKSKDYGWIVYTIDFQKASALKKLPDKCTIQVEAGQTVYMNEVFGGLNLVTYKDGGKTYTYSRGTVKTSAIKNEKYKSSNKKVATINSKSGLMKTKKAGKTTITVTYKKKTYKCTLKVVKKGKLKSTTKYKKINKAAAALVNMKNTKVNSKNIIKLITKAAAYSIEDNKTYHVGGWKETKNKNILIIPLAEKAGEIAQNVFEYCEKNEPLENGTIVPETVEAEAGTNVIKVALNKAPTKKQIYIMQYRVYYDMKELSQTTYTNTGYLEVEVWNDDECEYEYDSVYYTADFVKGSTTIEMKLYTDEEMETEYVLKPDSNVVIDLGSYDDTITLNIPSEEE